MKNKGATAVKSKRADLAPEAEERQTSRWPVAKLAGLWGMNTSTLYGILVSAGLDGGEGFEFEPASCAAIAHFKGRSEQNAKAGEEAATRKKIADADHAEMDFMVAARKLMSVDEG